MISEHLTNLTTTASFTDVAVAWNNMWNGAWIFIVLIFFFVMTGLLMYSWSNDLLSSFLNSAFFYSIIGFIFSLVKDSAGTRFLGFNYVIFFIVITGLLYVAKQIEG